MLEQSFFKSFVICRMRFVQKMSIFENSVFFWFFSCYIDFNFPRLIVFFSCCFWQLQCFSGLFNTPHFRGIDFQIVALLFKSLVFYSLCPDFKLLVVSWSYSMDARLLITLFKKMWRISRRKFKIKQFFNDAIYNVDEIFNKYLQISEVIKK